MLILGLLGMYFDAAVVFVTKSLLFFRLTVAILCRDMDKMEMSSTYFGKLSRYLLRIVFTTWYLLFNKNFLYLKILQIKSPLNECPQKCILQENFNMIFADKSNRNMPANQEVKITGEFWFQPSTTVLPRYTKYLCKQLPQKNEKNRVKNIPLL